MFLLLIANTVVFAVDGTAAEGLDAAAWLILLLLFELETAHATRLSTRRALIAVHAVRLAAGAAVLAAAIGYVNEEDWLDSANAGLWIAVVALLEFKVRFAQGLARHLGVVETIAAVLYLGLAALVLTWAWRGEWFDAYDAALWLVAFATIEMNVLAIGR
ncbi:MAG: hypothetical protein GEV05_07295 [Betaproteobacteria bacterium]|nr:hypothetical protein [Betaproteobacteria bacterium]